MRQFPCFTLLSPWGLQYYGLSNNLSNSKGQVEISYQNLQSYVSSVVCQLVFCAELIGCNKFGSISPFRADFEVFSLTSFLRNKNLVVQRNTSTVLIINSGHRGQPNDPLKSITEVQFNLCRIYTQENDSNLDEKNP